MKLVFVILGSISILLTACAARAQEQSALDSQNGSELLEECQYLEKPESERTRLELIKELRCISYIDGVNDGYFVGRSFATHGPKTCRPENVTLGQLGLVVLKYLRAHPERLRERKILLVLDAMFESFPCEKDSGVGAVRKQCPTDPLGIRAADDPKACK
jgi:Rap1a immunity proteins